MFKYIIRKNTENFTNGNIMEELTGLGVKKQGRTNLKKMKASKKISNKELTKMKKTTLNEYENPGSAAFGKTASTIKRVILKTTHSLRTI